MDTDGLELLAAPFVASRLLSDTQRDDFVTDTAGEYVKVRKAREGQSKSVLLSLEEAAWINGEVIRVDGGEHISGATR